MHALSLRVVHLPSTRAPTSNYNCFRRILLLLFLCRNFPLLLKTPENEVEIKGEKKDNGRDQVFIPVSETFCLALPSQVESLGR